MSFINSLVPRLSLLSEALAGRAWERGYFINTLVISCEKLIHGLNTETENAFPVAAVCCLSLMIYNRIWLSFNSTYALLIRLDTDASGQLSVWGPD